MIIYIVLVAIILLLSALKIDKKKYCIIIGILMTVIVGLRSIDMGMGDTKEIYVSLFDQLSELSISESFTFIIQRDIEIVFYMLTRIYLIFTNNVMIYILLLSIPLNYAISRLIYKYSKIPSLSFIMFFSLNYFAFSFTLIRHCIALAILIISYDFLHNKDWKKFLITVFIAGLFHRTAWVFVLAYPLLYFKYSYKNLIAIVLAVVFSYTLGTKALQLLFSIVTIRHFSIYANPETNTLTFFAINLVIMLFIIILIPKYKEEKESHLLLNLLTLGICTASCMIFISEAFRISSFFSIYSIIALPNAVKLIEDQKYKDIVIIMLCTIFILYFFGFTIHNNQIYPYEIGTFWR